LLQYFPEIWTSETMVEVRLDAKAGARYTAFTSGDRQYTRFEQAEHVKIAYRHASG
jgi:hypothetical protein